MTVTRVERVRRDRRGKTTRNIVTNKDEETNLDVRVIEGYQKRIENKSRGEFFGVSPDGLVG